MRLLDSEAFLTWAGEREIGPDGAGSYRLKFQSGRRYDRFWVMPEFMGAYPHFAADMLEGLGPWKTCVAWFPRGRWPGRVWGFPANPVDDVRLTILRSFAIPEEFTGAVEFSRDERGQLLTLAFIQMIFGGNISDDVHLIPDHGRAFLMISHHEVIHVTFHRPGLIRPFARFMEEHDSPLPSDPPDATFYRPRWMKSPRTGPDQAG